MILNHAIGVRFPVAVPHMDISELKQSILPKTFYLQNTFICLKDSLGKILVHEEGKNTTAGRIVEVEAYIGGEDKGSHTYLNKKTPRTTIQFEEGGYAYIYTVHTHHLFTFVTQPKDIPSVVLIRAVEPIYGIEIMKERRGMEDIKSLTNGPGKLCKAMNITKELYGQDLTSPDFKLYIVDDGFQVNDKDIVKTARVGIDYAEEYKDVPWRYYIKDNPFVSRK